MEVYTLVRDEFSGWYLEAVKPAYQQPIDKITMEQTTLFLERLLKVLQPFMPFITEEIYQLMSERKDGDSIMVAEMPKAKHAIKHSSMRLKRLRRLLLQ
jgi:valyl-tRNA synthetase